MVWLSSVQSSKELRFTIWCIAVYFLSSVYFTDGSMKNAVYSLFSFSPIVASFYVFEKTRNLKEGEIERDVQRAIQFFCVFGCIAYQILYWGPLQVCHFIVNDFMKLSMLNQGIAIFIAASIAFFILILTKNCLCLQRMVISANKDYDVDICQKKTKKKEEEEKGFGQLIDLMMMMIIVSNSLLILIFLLLLLLLLIINPVVLIIIFYLISIY